MVWLQDQILATLIEHHDKYEPPKWDNTKTRMHGSLNLIMRFCMNLSKSTRVQTKNTKFVYILCICENKKQLNCIVHVIFSTNLVSKVLFLTIFFNISFMRQLECNSKWYQMYCSNAPGKNEKYYKQLKIEGQI